MQKKNPHLLFPIIIITTMIPAALSGCQPPPPPKSAQIYAGITLHEEQDVFIRELFRDIFLLIQQENTPYSDLILEMQDGSSDHSKQDSQIQRFLDLQYNVICADPADRTLASSFIQKAQEADVPILFFNRIPVETDLQLYENAYYLGTDTGETARLQAEIVLDAYSRENESIDRNKDGILSYAVLEGERDDPNTAVYTEYAVKELEEAGLSLEKAAGGMANASRSQAKELVTRWLNEEDFYVELLLCNHDEMALGALDAIEQEHADPIPIVGIGGTDEAKAAVDDGRMLGTVAIDKQEYANVFLETIRALGNGEGISDLPYADGSSIFLPTQKYTFKR